MPHDGRTESLGVAKVLKAVAAREGTELILLGKQATGEKYPLLNWRQTSGYLGLQNHSTPVSFRNIRLGPAQ